MSFLNKPRRFFGKQLLILRQQAACREPKPQPTEKVFWFFSSEKNGFLP
jgi:hypothetical protein